MANDPQKVDEWEILPPKSVAKPADDEWEIIPPKPTPKKKSPWYVPNLGLVRPMLAGAQKAGANATNALVYYADKITDALGIPKSDAARNIARDLETYSAANKEKGVGGIGGEIASGLGQAAVDIPTIMALGPAGLPVHGAVMGGANGGGIPGALTGAATGALTHGVLKGVSGIGDLARLVSGAGFGAATTPGGLEERVAGAATMGGLGLMGGNKQRGPVDLRTTQDVAKAKAMEMAGVKPIPDLAAQGRAVMGEPRGGSLLPTQELPKRVGPINLERLDLDMEPKKLLADTEDAIHAARMKARANKTWDAAQDQADLMGGAHTIGQAIGKPIEEVLDIYGKSTKDLDAKVLAARSVLTTSVERLHKFSREYLDNPTEEAYAKLQTVYQQHSAIQYAVGEGSSNIGRALNIHKKMVSAKDVLLTKGAKIALKTIGKDVLDPEAIQILAALDSSNPGPTLKMLAEHKPATFRQKAFELWMNAILSNPLTHVVNITSNTGTALWRAAEGIGGAGVEFVRHPLSPGKRESYFAESAYSAIGGLRGLSDGLKIFAEKMKGGLSPEDITKLEIPTHAIKGVKGTIIRGPSTALGAEDAFGKTVVYSSKIYSEAYKDATRAGLRGEARKNRIGELVAEPTEAMKAAAKQESLYLTFNNELGGMGKAMMALRKKTPGLEFIMPFVRTPLNIVKFGIQRTPLGAYSLIREARLGELPKAELSRRAFSIAATTGVGVLLAKMVSDGVVTGSGPTDGRERAQLYATGWQPRSVKVGGKYYGYGRVEPFATILGLYTDFWDIRNRISNQDANKIAGLIAASLRNNLLDKTFFSGAMDLIKATEDPDRFGANWVNRMSGSVIPAVVAGAARAIDPNIREAKTIIDTIKSRIPFVSQSLNPKLGPFGEPAQKTTTWANREFSPIAISKETNDPVYAEINRLGIKISRPTIRIGGKATDDAATRRLVQIAMPEVKKQALKIIASPFYASLKTDELKKKFLQAKMNKTRAFQRKLFVLEEMNQ